MATDLYKMDSGKEHISSSTVKKKVSITTVFQNEHVKFPFVADVYNTDRLLAETGVKIRDGELLWFLSKSSDKCINCCTWSNINNIFSVNVNSRIQLSLRNFHVVSRSRFTSSKNKGPSFDIHKLANLVKPDEPIFTVPFETESSKYSFLRANDGKEWQGRIVIQGKEDMMGYLAGGSTRTFVIPSNFDQEFLFEEPPESERHTFKTVAEIYNIRYGHKVIAHKVSTSNNNYRVDTVDDGDTLELHNGGQTEFRTDNYSGEKIQVVVFKRKKKNKRKWDIIHVPLFTRGEFKSAHNFSCTLPQYTSRGDFPVKTVQYIDSCLAGRHPLDHEILQDESPLTIFGLACFSVTNISLHMNDPMCPSFQATQSIPDYCHLQVTPAAEIPLDPRYTLDFETPKQTIQVLTAEQFVELKGRLVNSDKIPNSPTGTYYTMMNEAPIDDNPVYTAVDEMESSNGDSILDHEHVRTPNDRSQPHTDTNRMSTIYANDDDEDLYEDNNNVTRPPPIEGCPDYMNVSFDTMEIVRTPPQVTKTVDQSTVKQRPIPRVRSMRTTKRENERLITKQVGDTATVQSQGSNPTMNGPPTPPPQTSKPVPAKRNSTISISSVTEDAEEMQDEPFYHSEMTPYVSSLNSSRSSLDRLSIYEVDDAPPQMPPKQPHTRRSTDNGTNNSDMTSSSQSNLVGETVRNQMTTTPLRNNRTNPNETSKSPVSNKKPPPPVAKKPKPKVPLPTAPKPNKLKKPSNLQVSSTESPNVMNLKHQIAQKMREEQERKDSSVPVEQNNNESHMDIPQVSGRPVVAPRKPPNKPLPTPNSATKVPIAGGVPMFGFGPPAGGVAIFPVMSPQRTQQLPSKPNSPPPQPPARQIPAKPARAAPVLPPNAKPSQSANLHVPSTTAILSSGFSDSSEEGNDYQAISDDDENDYEFLSEMETARTSRGNLAPTLPPMATHPLITGKIAARRRDIHILDQE